MKTTPFRRVFLTIISMLMVGVFSCMCVSADELDTAEPIKLGQEKSITSYKDEANFTGVTITNLLHRIPDYLKLHRRHSKIILLRSLI